MTHMPFYNEPLTCLQILESHRSGFEFWFSQSYADHFWVSLIYVAMCGEPERLSVLQEWECECICKAPQPKCSPRYDLLQPLPLPSHEGTDTSGILIWNTVRGSVDIFRMRHVGGWMPLQEKQSGSVSHSVVSSSLGPHGLQPARLLCPRNFPGKNSGVGCHSLLQGIFPTQGQNPGLLPCRPILYHLSHLGSPEMTFFLVSFPQGGTDSTQLQEPRIQSLTLNF